MAEPWDVHRNHKIAGSGALSASLSALEPEVLW